MYSLKEIQRRVEAGPKDFVDQCDMEYKSRVSYAADRIQENMKKSPIVLLCGPSGSGKTTTAMKIEKELESREINSHTVSMDNYFKTLNPKTAPRTPEGDIDFESPLCMDMDLLNEHFSQIASGQEIKVPFFIFSRQKRSAVRFTPLRLKENEVVIFEGIHAFNEAITSAHPEAFNLYISVATDIDCGEKGIFEASWVRLVRRTVRDNNFRGADAVETLRKWENVVRGEKLNIFPNMGRADLQLDSSLIYDLPALKAQAVPLFQEANEAGLLSGEEADILEKLRLFPSIDEKYIPKDSLMREFIR